MGALGIHPRFWDTAIRPWTALFTSSLFDLEHSINLKRRLGDASYDLKTHVQVLSALLAEVSVELQSPDHKKLSTTEAFFCTT